MTPAGLERLKLDEGLRLSSYQDAGGVEWRPVAGLPHYEVSNTGLVRSLSRRVHNYIKPGRILVPGRKQRPDGSLVALYVVLGRGNTRYVHRLVLEAFVGLCPEGMEGCHGDGDASNNRVSNLRWDTHKANHADMVRHGTYVPPPTKRGERHSCSALWDEAVRVIRAEPEFHGVDMMLARAFGVSNQAVRRVRVGLTWGHVQ